MATEIILATSSNAYDASEKDLAKDITEAFNTAKGRIKSGLPGVAFDVSSPDIKGILIAFKQLKDKGDKKIREVKFVLQLTSTQLTLVARRPGADEGCGAGADLPPESDDMAKVKERRAFLVALNKFDKKLLPDSDMANFNKKHPPGLEEAVDNLAKLKEAKDRLKKLKDDEKPLEAKIKDLEAKLKPFAAQLAKMGKK